VTTKLYFMAVGSDPTKAVGVAVSYIDAGTSPLVVPPRTLRAGSGRLRAGDTADPAFMSTLTGSAESMLNRAGRQIGVMAVRYSDATRSFSSRRDMSRVAVPPAGLTIWVNLDTMEIGVAALPGPHLQSALEAARRQVAMQPPPIGIGSYFRSPG